MSANVKAIIAYLDRYLVESARPSIGAVEANALLAQAGLLNDSDNRPGKPLRVLLRDHQLPHAQQPGGKGTLWIIPHS